MMELATKKSLEGLYLFIATSAVTLNVILLTIGIKVKDRVNVNLTLGLASINIIMSLLTVLSLIINLIDTEIFNPIISCQIKGFLDHTGLLLSMMLISSVAVERLNVVLRNSFSSWLTLVYMLITLIVITSLLATSIQSQFLRLDDSIECLLSSPQHYKTSQLTLVLFLMGTLSFFFITVGCYSWILRSKLRPYNCPATGVIENKAFGKLNQGHTNLGVRFLALPTYSPSQAQAIRRLTIAIIGYTLIFITLFILFILKVIQPSSSYDSPSSSSSQHHYHTGGLTISLLLLAQPTLILLAHSNLYHQFLSLFQPKSTYVPQ